MNCPSPENEAQPRPIIGRPKLSHISTSYAERNNLNCRQFCKRLARLTLTYSRRAENLEAALWIYFAFWNFCRHHNTLRVSPCMEAGVTDHLRTIEEFLNAGADQS